MRWWLGVLLVFLLPEWSRHRLAAVVIRRQQARLALDPFAFFFIDVRTRPFTVQKWRAFRRKLKRVTRANRSTLCDPYVRPHRERRWPPLPDADPLAYIDPDPDWKAMLLFEARSSGEAACAAILEWLRAQPEILKARGPRDHSA